jgi:hypothetical protein
MTNEQSQPLSLTRSNDEHVINSTDDIIEELVNAYESKLELTEKENKESKEAMQRNFDLLRQEKLRQHEENTNNDLNYDSAESVNSGDNDTNYDTKIENSSDDNNDINYDSPDNADKEENSDNDSKYDT